MDIATIFKRLKENEELALKFHDIEASILTILNFTDLFEKLLDQIQLKFNVPMVWLSISKESEVSHLAGRLADKTIWRERITLIDLEELAGITANQMTPRLIDDNLDRYNFMIPDAYTSKIKSIAIAPISLDGKLIRSLNQGDFSPRRFHSGLDTGMLERLALKVSLCLSNVTAHEKLQTMAFHDPLTGLLNRRALDKALDREFSRAIRYHRPLSTVFVDLNQFKKINDTHGHEVGDAVLAHMASTLMAEKRQTDIVARFAGDEFVAILADTPSEKAEAFIRRVEARYSRPHKIGGISLSVRFSYGIASTQEGLYASASDLVKAADGELYKVKQRLTRRQSVPV